MCAEIMISCELLVGTIPIRLFSSRMDLKGAKPELGKLM